MPENPFVFIMTAVLFTPECVALSVRFTNIAYRNSKCQWRKNLFMEKQASMTDLRIRGLCVGKCYSQIQ